MAKSYKELKAEKIKLDKQVADAKKKEKKAAVKKVRELCSEFGITAGMLRGALATGRNRQPKTTK